MKSSNPSFLRRRSFVRPRGARRHEKTLSRKDALLPERDRPFRSGRLSRLAARHFSRAFFAEAFSSSGPSPPMASFMSSRSTPLFLSSDAIFPLPQFFILASRCGEIFEKILSSKYPSFLSSSVIAAVSMAENPLLASFLRSSFSVCALNDRSRSAASLIPPDPPL